LNAYHNQDTFRRHLKAHRPSNPFSAFILALQIRLQLTIVGVYKLHLLTHLLTYLLHPRRPYASVARTGCQHVYKILSTSALWLIVSYFTMIRDYLATTMGNYDLSPGVSQPSQQSWIISRDIQRLVRRAALCTRTCIHIASTSVTLPDFSSYRNWPA